MEEEYRKAIIKMVKEISDIKILKQIYTYINENWYKSFHISLLILILCKLSWYVRGTMHS